MKQLLTTTLVFVLFTLLPSATLLAQQLKDDGYRGIWYANQPSQDEYKYKYSGGFATYPQQHAPIAIYSKQAHKTFSFTAEPLKAKTDCCTWFRIMTTAPGWCRARRSYSISGRMMHMTIRC